MRVFAGGFHASELGLSDKPLPSELAARSLVAFRPNGNPGGISSFVDNLLVPFLGDETLAASIDLPLKKMLWPAEASEEWTSARPYLWRGMIIAGNRRELVALRPADGARQWSHRFREVVRGIGTSGDVLCAGSLKGEIFAFAPGKP
jgi:hypothetical protein